MSVVSATPAGTHLDGHEWTPVITQRHTKQITIANNGVLSAPDTGNGNIAFWMAEDFENEVWSSYEWSDAPARIFEGEDGDPFTAYRQVFEGKVSSLAREGITATLELLGPEADLNTPLLTLSYAGTGGVEGPTTLRGKLKPRKFGNCLTVDPVQVDPAKLVYQVHGYGAVGSIPQVYEFAQSYGPSEGNVASYADLIAMTLAPGEWATCNAQGLFRLGGRADKKLSADVIMPGSTIATIIPQLLAVASVPAAKIGSMAVFASSAWSLDQTEQTTVLEAVRSAALQGGGYILPDGQGAWQVGDYFATKAPIVLNEDRSSYPQVRRIKELPASPPVWKVSVGYDRCWNVHSESDVSPALKQLSEAQIANDAAAKAALEAAQLAAADATVANARVDAMSADGILDRSEKASVIREFAEEAAQQTGLMSQSTNVDVSFERSVLAGSFGALKTYLEALTPAYTNTAADTSIDRAAFDARWRDYWLAKQTLLNALAGKASVTATWGGVTGTGKPENYATVGAPIGTDVGGRPVVQLVGDVDNAKGNAQTAVDALKDGQDNVRPVRDLFAEAKVASDAAVADARKAGTDAQAQVTQARADLGIDIADVRADAAKVRADLVPTIADAKKAGMDASAQAAQVRADLIPTIADAKKAGMDASAAAGQIGSDLANEVNRAKGVEGTLTTKVQTAQGRADGAHTAISTETTQRSNADGALAQRIDTVESTANTDRTNTNTRITNEVTTLTNADVALGQRVDAVVTQVDTDRATNVVAIRDEAKSRSDADGALGQRLTSVEASSRGAGNLLFNTDFPTVDGWRFISANNSQVIDSNGINLPSDDWHPAGENVLTLHQANGSVADGNTYTAWQSTAFTVTPGEHLQAFTFVANHRCAAGMLIYWLDAYGNNIGFQGTDGSVRGLGGGRLAQDWDRVGFKSVQVPGNAQQAVMELRKYDTTPGQSDSWAWWWRPYIGAARGSQAEWNAYSPGSAKVSIAASNAKISDEATARSNADGALGQRIDTVTATANTDRTNNEAAIRDERIARSDADGALGTRIDNVTTTANTDRGRFNTAIQTEQTARSNGDGALGVRIDTVVAQANTDRGDYTAKIKDETLARTTAVDAVASRVGSIEVSSATASGVLNVNPNFLKWDDGLVAPNGWSIWGGDGSMARIPSGQPTGGYEVRTNGNGNGEYGLDESDSRGPAFRNGWFVLEADVELHAGDWRGSGLTIQGAVSLDFASDTDTYGAGANATYIGRRRYSKLVKLEYDGYRNWHAMVNWTGFGKDLTAKSMTWYRAAVRPATDGEIKAQKADASLNTPGTGVIAKLSSEETARIGADSALGGRIQTIEADYVTNGAAANIAQGKVNEEAAVRSGADGALSTRLGTVETSSRGAGNLLSNTEILSLDGWSISNNSFGAALFINMAGDTWHPVGENAISLYSSANPTNGYVEIQGPSFAATAGETFQVYAYTASHRSNAWVSLFFLDASGNMVGYAGENYGARIDAGGNNLSAFDQTGCKYATAPSGTVRACIVLRQYGIGAGDPHAWFVRPYVGYARVGQTEWNPFSHGSSKVQINAANTRITDEATASSNRDIALGGRISTVEADYVTNGSANNIAQAKVNDEAAARAGADGALSGRISTTESRFAQTPVQFFARSYGNGDNQSPFGHTSGVANGSGTMIGTNGRSYGVYVFNSDNALIAANSYDVYGDGAARGAMANFLNGITNGQAVIVTTCDEPSSWRTDSGLLAAMERCGSGDAFYNAQRPGAFAAHAAYVLIGRAGVGRGNGQEYYKGDYATAPNSWLEVPFSLIRGVPVRGDATAAAIANARITDEITTRADAVGALSGRTSTIESKLELQNGSAMSARISDNYNTLASANAALATRTSGLETSTQGITTSLVPNDKFAVWPDGAAYPTSWITWVGAGNYRVERWAASTGSPWSIRTLNDHADVESGFYQTIKAWAGKWVVEVTAQCVGNSLSGAGVTLHGQYSLDFISDPDTNGLTDNQGDRIRTWTKMFDLSQDFITSIGGNLNVHAMVGWSGFGRASVPKYVQWYRLAVRPATAGEILANKVNNDVTALTARVSTEETARISGDTALATRTGIVEAQVSNDSNNLLRNGTFNAPGWVRGSTGAPPYWNVWAQDGGAYLGSSDRSSAYGAVCPLQIDRNGNNNGISQNIGTQAAGWYILDIDITAEDGNWTGCGVHINFNNGFARNFHFGSEPDTNGGVVSGNMGSVNRKFSTMFYNGAVGSNTMFYLMAGWEGFATGQGFLRTIWHKAVVRPASDAEIKAQKVIDANLIARVQNSEGAIANVQTKVASAWSEKTVSAGTSAATITMRAVDDNGNATSDVTLAASRIALRNTETGGISKGGMVMSGGNAVFDGSITANGGILVGNGKLRVQVQATDYAVSHGQRIDFGYDLGRAPNITFGPCPVSLNSGEVYAPYASDLSATGFTAQLVIQSAPQSSGQSTGGFANQGNNIWDGGKQGKPNAANGTYSLTVNLQATANAYREYNEDYR